MNPVGLANSAAATILSLALCEIQWFDVGHFLPV
jgi:hypothetical protein